MGEQCGGSATLVAGSAVRSTVFPGLSQTDDSEFDLRAGIHNRIVGWIGVRARRDYRDCEPHEDLRSKHSAFDFIGDDVAFGGDDSWLCDVASAGRTAGAAGDTGALLRVHVGVD